MVEDKVARQRSVKLGGRKPGKVEIIEGVEVGEMIVLAGYEQVADGDRVKTVGESEADESSSSEGDKGDNSRESRPL